MRYFLSDTHFGDDRLGIIKPNVFFRTFNSIEEQNEILLNNILKTVKDGDEIYHGGDVIVNLDYIHIVEKLRDSLPNSKFNLIIGNYDVDKLQILSKFFDNMVEECNLVIEDKNYYFNHYPEKCIDKEFSITGHIHGLWKVQKNMVNIGVDAWHYLPIPETQIAFVRNACEKYYDKNVFPF